MKKSITILALLFIFSVLSISGFSQQWRKNLPEKKDGNYTLFDYQKAFNEFWAPFNVDGGGYYIDSEGNKKKAPGYKQFKRAEWYWKYRVDAKTGAFPDVTARQQFEKWLDENSGTKASINGNWISIGPSNSNSPDFGTGRTNVIAFHPSNNNIFYVGAPSGGLWKTIDHGTTWNVLTDQNPVLGISTICLANDFATSNKMFIGTGDKDGGSLWGLNGGQAHDNEGVGILLSNDGGVTWTTTSLQHNVNEQIVVSKIVAHPSDNNIYWATTNQALYKSTDGGLTWEPKKYDKFMDLELKPGDPNTLYASTSVLGTPYPRIYLSTDGGETWNVVLQLTIDQYRIDLAVSPASPTTVYACISMSDYNGSYAEYGSLWAIYKSTNSGASYSSVFDGTAVNKNLFGWYTNGSDAGGQGDYDMAFCVSPTDANRVYVGGVNGHMSTDGAVNFTAVSCWTSSTTYNRNGSPIVHADHHYAIWRPSDGRLFDCNDGGLHYTTNNGSSWVDITPGLVNGQIYGIGVAQNVSGEVVAGFQDNGTKRVRSGNTNWDDVTGGDGMHCAVDYNNNNNQYATYAYGRIYYTTNNWTSYSTINTGGSGANDWAAPLEIDPAGGSILYYGNDYVRRYNGSWSTLSQLLTGTSTTDGNTLTALSVYHNGSDIYIYAAGDDGTSWKIWKSPLGGGSGSGYTNVTGNLPGNAITDIEIDYNDPNHVWVTLGGYDGNRVYETTNGGSTWTNISAGLPELPAMTIVQYNRNTTEDELYIGMDVGVYVKQGNSPWVLFSGNLPNAVMTDLEFYYGASAANDVLYGATWARGVWKTEPYQCPSLDAAISNITVPEGNYCTFPSVTPTVTLSNIGTSTLTSATISYSIDGGAPVTQAWSGSLINGASVNVTFPAITLTGGSHSITASVSAPNGGTDQVSSNNTYSKTYFVADNSLPYTQDFDEFLNAIGYIGTAVELQECWTNDGSESTLDWSVNYGGTPSANTGPSSDHTSGSGKYLYVETSGITTTTIANVLSPTFDLSAYATADFTFWYHMYGTEMGSLQVDLFYNGTWHNGVTGLWNGISATSVSGNKGDTWFQASFNANSACGYSDFQVRIKYTSINQNPTYYGDAAIDDFYIDGTYACTAPTIQASNFSAVPSYTSINVSWNRGDGDRVLVVARQGSAVNQDPTFGTPYNANPIFGSGDQIGTGNYVVFNGNATSVNVTGLSENTTYHFAVYEYNLADNCYMLNELTGNATTLVTPPDITGATPDNFYADKGKQIILSGTNLGAVTSVTLGGVTGTINAQTSTSITVTFPAGNYSNNTLSATNTGGSDTYTVTVNKRNTIPVGGGTDYHTTIQSALDGLYGWFGTNSFDLGTGGLLSGTKYIDVYNGTYTETVTPNIGLNPSATNRLVIQNSSNQSPVVNATGLANGFYIGALNYVTVTGFSVYGANSDNIYTEGDNNVISYNKSYSSVGGSGIRLSTANNSTVDHNLVFGNHYFGIHQINSVSSFIKNNTAYDNGYSFTGPQTLVYSFSGSVSITDRTTVNAPIIVSDNITITNVRVLNMNITHTYDGDLDISLVHPDATSIDLSSDNGSTGDNYINTIFDDAAATSITSGTAPFTGTFRPEVALTAFDSKSSNGTWNLRVYDDSNGDEGTITGWQLELTYTADENLGAGIYIESGNVTQFENNILIAKDGSPSYYALNTGGNTVTSNYNNYYGTNPPIYNGSTAVTLAGWTGAGANDISFDPLFVNAPTDFHLRSTAGSYNNGVWPPTIFSGGSWTLDATNTSPSIDAGNTTDLWSEEPTPNGGRINQGAYGNTVQASKTGCSMPVAPTSVTATDTEICNGESTTLSYTGGSGTTFNWYSTSCGGDLVGSDNNLSVSPTTTTTYYGRWENACGSSTCQTVTITVNDIPEQPSAITGNANPTIGASETYSVTNVPGVTYTWSVPGDWTIDAGQGTNSIDVTVGSNSGNVSVTPSNACGNGTAQTLAVTPVVSALTWDGSSSNDWFTAANWTPAVVPTGTDDVIIAAVATLPLINDGIGSIAVCNNLTINAAASVTIAPNGYLTVNGAITNNAGNAGLVIQSDAAGTGSLIHNSGSGVPATVQSYNAGSQWHMFSSPVDNAPFTVLPSTANTYYYDESTADYWTGTLYGAGSISGWTGIPANMAVAKGYAHYFTGAATLNYTGNLYTNTATNTISVPYTDHGVTEPNTSASWDDFDGWNLIGNPYTSAIDWDDPSVDYAGANLLNAVYTYDDKTAHTYTSYVDGVGTMGGSRYIPAGQGFFVKGDATELGGTLNIGANARVHNAQTYWKGYTETPENFIRLEVSGNGFKDETVVRMLSNATNAMDNGMDAYKFFTWHESVPQIYTRAEGSADYSINTLPVLEEGSISIPLRFMQTGDSYTIKVSEFNFNGMKVYLKDNSLSKTSEIALDDLIELNSSEDDALGRYELVFEKSAVSVVSDVNNVNVWIYPNPNEGTFNIRMDNYASGYELQISNVIGQLVYKNVFEDAYTKEIKISGANSGIYFLKICLEDGSIVNRKIIVN